MNGKNTNDVWKNRNTLPNKSQNQSSKPNSITSNHVDISRKKNEMTKLSRNNAENIFKDASEKHRKAAEKHLADFKNINNTLSTNQNNCNVECTSSSSEDDEEIGINDGCVDKNNKQDKDLKKNAIFNKMFATIKNGAVLLMDSDKEFLSKTEDYINDALESKNNVCLICIETIKKINPIWNCNGCFSMFHINCIQKWIQDGSYQTSILSEELFPSKEKFWNCPKCRQVYKQSDFPKKYFCFCRKLNDPPIDVWLVPHSCGDVCGKPLLPQCGHTCLLLCHPGPCPPCPQTVKTNCHCGRGGFTVKRCANSKWTCNSVCNGKLACGLHKCKDKCHPGDCGVCLKSSIRSCQCGRHTTVVACSKPVWKCEDACLKDLECGFHKCELVCHEGICPPCPGSLARSCPCGKTKFELGCTEEVPTCLETCGKLLDCGLHNCLQRCHLGPCGTCREMRLKKCKCGRKEKELQCYKEYQCDVKCSNYKDCGVHQCKRRCCDGSCPPCILNCGKILRCKKHKCLSTCHLGPCYPCTLTCNISCNCGKTVKTVPCGADIVTNPPKCSYPCSKPSDCHHQSRELHACHFNVCPPCKQICELVLPHCQHTCSQRCHSAIRVRVEADRGNAIGPWEQTRSNKTTIIGGMNIGKEDFELVSYPCLPCQILVGVACLGKHETIMVACSLARESSCQRPCGRLLMCSHHSCQLICHSVMGARATYLAGVNCQQCELPCTQARPPDCVHACLRLCHPGKCSPCFVLIKMRCHCRCSVLHLECHVWSNNGLREREVLASCKSRCFKKMECGHQCTFDCHSGLCSSSTNCQQNVKVKCPCGRRKKDKLCHNLRISEGNLDKASDRKYEEENNCRKNEDSLVIECDEMCLEIIEKHAKEREAKEVQKQELEERRRKEENADLDRKFAHLIGSGNASKRLRNRNRDEIENDEGFFFLAKKYISAFFGISCLLALLAYFIYFLLSV